MGQFGMGQSLRRLEDERLVTGAGDFTGDAVAASAAAVFLRSPHAHALLRAVDTKAAAAMPGVLAVLTGADLAAAGIRPLPCRAPAFNRDGSPMPIPARPALVRDRVRHVGDPVACVVATSVEAAQDAAEAVVVDYAALPAVTDLARALEPTAPVIWPEADANLALDWAFGDETATAALFAQAAHVTTVDLVNNRLVPNALEPRGCVADYDEGAGRWTLRTGGQGVHSMQAVLAEMFGSPLERFRVVQADVGGGFGMKIWVYPEYPVCLLAARMVGRPVRWIASRTEGFVSDTHGRDHLTRVRLAVDEEARMLALRVQVTANLGAYVSQFAPLIPTAAGAKMYTGVYALRAMHLAVRCAYTNTVPVDAYRGAGRPEAAYAIERVVDAAARELGLDPVLFRRRNFITPDAMPYRTATGAIYDSGEFARLLDAALLRADASGFAARRAAAKARGRLRGLGLAYYVEQCAGGRDERARLEIAPDGTVRVFIGTQSNGQGHATAYAQLLGGVLGIEPRRIETVQGDTDKIASGRGTGGSRSVPVGGSAVVRAGENAIQRGKAIAGELLEAAVDDLAFAAGRYTVVGTDRSVSLAEVAARAGGNGLEGDGSFEPPIHTYPNGAHLCEVEIEVATGVPTIVRYTVVDDFGRVLNPLLLAGQVHGGIAQGIGQALFEEAVYDHGTGQLVAGSFMDYTMPRAGDLPGIGFSYLEVPCTTNPLGMKGAGEAGAIGAPPAVINALVDALAEHGVRHVDMPATPERLWRLLHPMPDAASARDEALGSAA